MHLLIASGFEKELFANSSTTADNLLNVHRGTVRTYPARAKCFWKSTRIFLYTQIYASNRQEYRLLLIIKIVLQAHSWPGVG